MLLPALLGVYDVTKKDPICEDRFFCWIRKTCGIDSHSKIWRTIFTHEAASGFPLVKAKEWSLRIFEWVLLWSDPS